MKNLIKLTLILAVTAFSLTACSTSNKAVQVSRSDVSGKWTVNTVSLDGFPAGYSVRNVFDMADYRDFERSNWELKGNGTGSISLTNGAVQPIYWSVNKSGAINTFQFKKLADGQKAKNVSIGYSLEFGDVSKGSAVFKTPVSIPGGQTAYINFSFVKQ